MNKRGVDYLGKIRSTSSANPRRSKLSNDESWTRNRNGSTSYT